MGRWTVCGWILGVLSIISACGGAGAPVVRAAKPAAAPESTITTNELYFHSRDGFCKSPFGAVVEGTTVRFRMLAKKDELTRVDLVVNHKIVHGNNERRELKIVTNVAMRQSGVTNGRTIWEASVAFPQPALYGYHFELYKTAEDRLAYGNNQDKVEVPYVNVMGTGGLARTSSMKRYFRFPFNQTVYRKDFKVPAWSQDMQVYYIFPERFRNGDRTNDPRIGVDFFYGKKPIEVHTNWNDAGPWVPGAADGNTQDDAEYCNDFYGGDLAGIIQKLDYIKSLGINVIYINPIFKAPSNHKYDTADYLTIDPAFGDMALFRKLVAEAKKRGIRILLDASLNHCGSDSVYMDRYGKYPTLGAFENETIRKDSPYYDWFEFNENAGSADRKYNQWANPTLANLKESDSYKEFAYRGKDSITRFWLREGIGGWRMDVTPWVSDEFWREWRTAVKQTDPDAFTIAEVWFDASKYFIGDMYDSTMNYIFRSAALSLGKGADLVKVQDALEMLRENYPVFVQRALMNLISSHDLPRAIWEFGYAKKGARGYETALARLRLALVLQYTWTGAPTIYYGDELGLTGGHDPYNRGTIPWKDHGGDGGDAAVMEFYRTLATMRQAHPFLASGETRFLHAGRHTLLYERSGGGKRILVAFNNGKTEAALPQALFAAGRYADLLDGGKIVPVSGEGLVLPALGFRVLLQE